MKPLENILNTLLESTKAIGLSEQDLNNAKEFLEHHEYGLCFDTIITQLYEYDIEIDEDFYEVITKIANKMGLPFESYSFMKELIRSESTIPKTVKTQLANIISTLKQH
jgi:hypothetical protein